MLLSRDDSTSACCVSRSCTASTVSVVFVVVSRAAATCSAEHVLPFVLTTNVTSPSDVARFAEAVDCSEDELRRRPCTDTHAPFVRSLFAEKREARLLAADAKRSDPEASPVLLLTVEKRRIAVLRPRR